MIFLLILKIIGIIILVCLGLLIFLLLTVLFIPICYEISLKSDENNILVQAKGHWLFKILGFSGEYTKENYYLAYRILFRKHKIIDSDTNEESLSDFSGTDLADNGTIDADTNTDTDTNTNTDTNTDTDISDTIIQKPVNAKTISTPNTGSADFKAYSQKFKSKYNTFKNFIDKLRLIFNKTKTFFSNPQNKAGLNHLKQEIIKFIKIIFSGKISADLDYSTGSPDTTALVLGMISVFPIGYKNKWRVMPDFETENFYLHGHIHAKGKIFVFRLVGISIRILFDKNCQKLYSYIKN